MRYLKYLVLIAVLALPTVYSQAQVAIGVRIGPDYGLYNPPPVCAYGYYPDYPYNCAPYGYWGPEWFAGGVFIGAGPWYHFYYTHPVYYRRFYGPREFGFRGGFERFGEHGFRGEERRIAGGDRAFRGGEHFREGHGSGDRDHSFYGGHRNEFHEHGGCGFHGRGGFHTGEGFRNGNGSRGGGHREHR